MTPGLLATAFVATFTATPLHARSLALTNADVTRLAALKQRSISFRMDTSCVSLGSSHALHPMEPSSTTSKE